MCLRPTEQEPSLRCGNVDPEAFDYVWAMSDDDYRLPLRLPSTFLKRTYRGHNEAPLQLGSGRRVGEIKGTEGWVGRGADGWRTVGS